MSNNAGEDLRGGLYRPGRLEGEKSLPSQQLGRRCLVYPPPENTGLVGMGSYSGRRTMIFVSPYLEFHFLYISAVGGYEDPFKIREYRNRPI